MKRIRTFFLTMTVLLASTAAMADLVVVVSSSTSAPRLTRDEVTNIFLGRHRQLPGGQTAYPVDLPINDAERAQFYRLLVGKEPAEINAYWSRLIFSGKTAAPRLATSVDDAVRFVATTPGGIAYVDRSRVDGRLKILLELER